MGASDAAHPTDQTLRSYGLGKLEVSQWHAVNDHLAECRACRLRVAEMTSDTFLDRLRKAQPGAELGPPVGSSLPGLSMMGGEAPAGLPPPASTLPPGLSDHPDYEILRELGRGGMGVVYLADNKLMGRREVLKVVSSHLLDRKGVLERFLREIRAAALLQHPNVVSAYSATRVGESIVFAMQYVEGYDLAKLVEKSGPLPVAHACNFVYQAALGLQHAHERGMVHRDIKPANLILAREGNKPVIKILDFGLAKVTSEAGVDGGLTHEGQMLGTPHYVAPEQTVNAQKADIRADIYSLGCTLYCLLSGYPPFDAPSLYELLQAHHSMDAKPLNFIRPEVPAELAAVVAKMLAKEPERRFQEPKEVAQALTPFFKKGSVVSKGLKPELSRAEPPETQPATAVAGFVPTRPASALSPAPAPPRSTPGHRRGPEPTWESLVGLKETESSRDAAPAAASNRRPSWLWPAVAVGVLLIGLVAVWGVLIKIRTPEGMIVLADLPDQATVLVDGKKATVHWPDGGGPAEITAPPGDHVVQVKKDGFTIRGQTVTIEAGRTTTLTVQLEPLEILSPETVAANGHSSRAKVDKPPVLPSGGGVATTSPTSPLIPAANTDTKPKVAVDDRPGKAGAVGRIANEPARPHAIDAREVLNGKAEILRGHWLVEGRELLQTVATKGAVSDMLFGDLDWTDYDFTVDLMREKGSEGGAGLSFRKTERNRNLHFGISTGEGGLTAYKDGNERELGDAEFRLVDHKWYTARVQVHRNHIECTLHDGENEVVHLEAIDDDHPRGRVGLGSESSSYRFRNIRVTAPDGKTLWEMPPAAANSNTNPKVAMDDKGGKANAAGRAANGPARPHAIDARQVLNGKAEIVSGRWLVEGRELLQTVATKGLWACLLFGDLDWTDYDFTVDLMREKGGEGGAVLYFRRTDGTERNRNLLDFGIGTGGGWHSGYNKDGKERELGVTEFRLVDHKWYTARVHVRRNQIECTLHDGENEVVHLESNDDDHPRGRVGLGTFESSYRFRNIRVTAPDGTVLWEMPPAVGEPPMPAPAGNVGTEPPRQPAKNAARSPDRKAIILSGEWRIEGQDLVQTQRAGGGRLILSDSSLSSYDFKFQVQVVAGAREFAALFHNQDNGVDGGEFL
ncbi:MAG: protein kinase domain-containing protein, partial [Isosphaeraceae bacterium]